MKPFLSQWNWFSRLLFMMVALGGLPVVALAVLVLFMPTHLSIEEYRQVLGVLMMTIPVISLCLAGIASRAIKSSYQKILMAQRQFKSGDFSVRISSSTDKDTNMLFKGFNSMAEVVEVMFEKLVQQEKDKVLSRQALQVAHDIRSPLSSLQTASILLRSSISASDESLRDAIDLLQLSQKRLESIANNLLQKETKQSIVSEDFSIHEILDELVGEFKSSELGRGVDFKKIYWSSAVYIMGNRTNLQRALGNVIKNALEAMQSSAGERILQVATRLNDKNAVVVGIKDTGVGIEAGKLSRVLGGNYTDGKLDGHGIGMQVLREVVAAHCGDVKVFSQVNEWTEFLVTLPVRPNASDDVKHALEIPYQEGTNIIVIDDDPGVREQWRILLKSYDVPLRSYSCWEEFVLNFNETSIGGTVIADYHFDNSEVNGIEILSRLKTTKKYNLILATAEYWKPAIKSEAEKLGALICPKPLPSIALSKNNSKYKIMVVDDDDAILLSWKTMKKHLNIAQLDCFKRYEDVVSSGVDPSVYDACFIDKNVEGSEYGAAEMLLSLKEKGAKWVVLASGEQLSTVAEDLRLSKVDKVSKDKVPISLEPLLMTQN